jgi:2-polyprenyl-3-methyl-5-hydroxy-6-metoxy-1,4-benzoquinol methylase
MKKVYEVYNKIFNWFDEHRNKELMESYYLNLILDTVGSTGTVLDLGCGTGEPLAQYFIEKGFKVTGVDGSKKMIELCKKRFPHERWIVSDMLDINLNEQFDNCTCLA